MVALDEPQTFFFCGDAKTRGLCDARYHGISLSLPPKPCGGLSRQPITNNESLTYQIFGL